MSLHSLETWPFEMPERPIAWTSSSTRRVETLPIQASWMTVTSAFSAVLRGSRKGGNYEPWRSFRHPQLERAQARVGAALAITIAVIEPFGRALMTPGADQAFDIGFHQDLQHRLGNHAQEIAVPALLQRLDQCQSLFSHRVLGGLAMDIATPA